MKQGEHIINITEQGELNLNLRWSQSSTRPGSAVEFHYKYQYNVPYLCPNDWVRYRYALIELFEVGINGISSFIPAKFYSSHRDLVHI